jgi:hypothetical protein
MASERREHQRWPSGGQISIAGSETRVEGALSDISLGGARILLDAYASVPDGPHQLVLRIEDQIVELAAELVREQPTPEAMVLGFRFKDVERSVLEPIVEKLRREG